MLLHLLLAPVLASPGPSSDPWQLIRVDSPDHPEALASSREGSVLLSPPTDAMEWSVESVPEPDGAPLDTVVDERLIDAIGLQPWHDEGHLGQGVKVAVFDLQWFGSELLEEELGPFTSHDCWASSDCSTPIDSLNPLFDFERGVHGVACAEVIHDIAPEAELYLVRVNGQTTFENAIDWAIREGIDLISMSMTFFNESFYDGTGPISEPLSRLEDAGILMVTSAGNNALNHYEDTFRDLNNNGFHEFQNGWESLPIRAEGGDGRVAAVLWDEFERCGVSDFEVRLLDSQGNRIRESDATQSFQNEKCAPVERIRAPIELEGDWVYLQIRRLVGPDPMPLDIMSFSGPIWGAMPQNSMADPAPHPLAFSVAAVPVEDYLHSAPEAFSSQGPSRGGHFKPDLAAPDGVSTRSYGAQRFFGTSASAPVAAGALAVRMSSEPSLSPREAAEDLRAWAWRGSAHWTQPDPGLGAGRLRLPPPEDLDSEGCASGVLQATLLLLPLCLLRRNRES